MSDRLTGIIVMLLALAFFASAIQLEEPFFADPMGPKAFPMMISAVMLVAGMVLVLRPDAEPNWPNFSTFIRISLAVILMVAYAFSLKPFGFILSTAIGAGLLSYMLKPNMGKAALTGVGLSVGLFVLFKYGLGLSLFALPRWLMG